jgi:hypothetical protein
VEDGQMPRRHVSFVSAASLRARLRGEADELTSA